jgi:bidirectional [NiFe] hydrogenase diaphorase subunit
MITFRMNGLEVKAEEGWTVLETAKFYGLEIPTLCFHEGLKTKLVSSCTYPAEEGLVVRTDTNRVWAARRMMIELMLAMAPGSKVLQDMASKFNVTQVRFTPKNEECVLCGLCVRMCAEQMNAKAIGFQKRGLNRKISTPFDMRSEECRLCGACMYICPVCQLRCQGPNADTVLCNGCLTMEPTCLDHYDDLQCWMYDAGRCGTCVREKT